VCGIAGLISLDGSPLSERDFHSLGVANDSMRHRGPDDNGLNRSVSRIAAFAHRRLSIIDPTPEAHQPMIGARGTMLVFNGEIYNFRELIAEYKLNVPLSDTAVLLALLETHGISILPKLRGFFSFAWWDDNKRALILARDPIGKKPLYYGAFNNRFVFASEIRALVASGLAPLDISEDATARYFRSYCIPHPNSMLNGVQKLPPGSTLRLSQFSKPIVERWYRLPKHHAVTIDYEEALNETRRILERSVRDRLVSDVPVGAFLSAGLDSNAIVGLAMRESSTPIETFSIGFSSASTIEDETPLAKIGAQTYGTSHHEWKISDTEIAESLPDFFNAMDSPTGDGLNSFLVSKATRRVNANLKVVLSGVGGDEAFLGYSKYRWLAQRAKVLGAIWSLPNSFRISVSESLLGLDHSRFNSALRSAVMPEHSRTLFSKRDIQCLTGSTLPINDENPVESDALYSLLRSDIEHYLPDMLLRDLDAMTMSQSLEARAPLLDRELLEFTWQLPLSIKARGTSKQLLSDAVSDLLPKEISQKPKTGFELPMREWLMRGTLRPYLDELTSDKLRVIEAGLMKKDAVVQVYRNFLDGRSHYLKPWSIIVLEHWYRSMENISQSNNTTAAT
jgi:asparagine synthase (glutamine-hydrolysing)